MAANEFEATRPPRSAQWLSSIDRPKSLTPYLIQQVTVAAAHLRQGLARGTMTLPLGAIAGHYNPCVTRLEYMPAQATASHGSVFRSKKNRFLARDQPLPPGQQKLEDASSTHNTASLTTRSSTSGPRPATARARRNSSISSITDITSSIRPRSTSLRGSNPRSPKSDTVAPTTSARDGR